MLPVFEAMNNNRQRALLRLAEAVMHGEVHKPCEEQGFISTMELIHAAGTSGPRRLRELREEHNVPIEMIHFRTGKNLVYFYRLDCDPGDLDWPVILKE